MIVAEPIDNRHLEVVTNRFECCGKQLILEQDAQNKIWPEVLHMLDEKSLCLHAGLLGCDRIEENDLMTIRSKRFMERVPLEALAPVRVAVVPLAAREGDLHALH